MIPKAIAAAVASPTPAAMGDLSGRAIPGRLCHELANPTTAVSGLLTRTVD